MTSPFRRIQPGISRIATFLNLESFGKRTGDLRLKYSSNEHALGYIPIPVGVIVGEPGPTVLLIGGCHGDEFEGPVAVLKLLKHLEPEQLRGRIIALPALNAPALNHAARVSPLDNGNLNRAFPGNPDGGPTEMIAHFVEKALMPICDYVIDLHSGGKAAWFSPCAMTMITENRELSRKNLELAEAFGAPLIWLMGALNDNRSVNSAADRQGLPMIAAELGGGGQVSPETLSIGEHGLINCLVYLGVLPASMTHEKHQSKYFYIDDPSQHVYSPHRGLFEPLFAPGDIVKSGDKLGVVYNIQEIEREPTTVCFPVDGVAYVRCHRGLVERGELLALVGKLASRPDLG